MHALIVDAEDLFSLSFQEILSTTSPFRHIVTARDEHEFLSVTSREKKIDLVALYPASLGSNGDRCVTLARRLYPEAKILIFTPAAETSTGAHLNDSKIHYLSRAATINGVANKLREIMGLPARLQRISASSLRSGIQREASRPHTSTAGADSLLRLSYRQGQILAMAADGLPNKEIAARLDIAEGTVKAHMHAIFRVLQVTNRTQAVIRFANLSNQPKRSDLIAGTREAFNAHREGH